jgi:pimeloyl-ACP methyl ester carboxylesterase
VTFGVRTTTLSRVAASVAGGRLVEFPGVAHMIQMEELERFDRLTLDFFAGVDRDREAVG